MTPLYIEQSKSSPLIRFEPASGILFIQGDAYPENAFQFFDPIYTWISEYLSGLNRPCILRMHLDYLNTSSSKCLMDLIDLLEESYRDGKDVRIEWLYDPDNDSSLELAEEFSEDLKIPFAIIAVEE